jgi:photosystem II stability/assembly factor-like uncharacterized protein
MDAPSASASARVIGMVTRSHTHPPTGRRAALILALWLAAAWTVPAIAQDEPDEMAPVPAVIMPLAPSSLLLDAAAAGDALVAVGERGHILVSTDGGALWRQSEVPSRSMLAAVTFHDDRLGWAVGHDSVVLRTSDGGTTWEILHWAPEDESPFFDVWFDDAVNGIAIGAYGSFYRTADGGETWDFEPIGDMDWHLHDIVRAADGTMYIAAEAGTILRSDDAGSTWIELPSPYEGSFFGILPLGADGVLAYGLRGHLFRTEDKGESWTAIETGTVAMLTAGAQLADGTVLIAGLGGTVLTSDDGGRSFALHQQPGRRGISSVLEIGEGTLLMTGEFGVRTATIADLVAGREGGQP